MSASQYLSLAWSATRKVSVASTRHPVRASWIRRSASCSVLFMCAPLPTTCYRRLLAVYRSLSICGRYARGLKRLNPRFHVPRPVGPPQKTAAPTLDPDPLVMCTTVCILLVYARVIKVHIKDHEGFRGFRIFGRLAGGILVRGTWSAV